MQSAHTSTPSHRSPAQIGTPGISRIAVALMIASGFAALGYQIVWTQQSALWLGHESAAILAVVAAFFGGTAVGSLTLGARIDRSSHPARWFAACEALIGIWSLALAFLMAPVANGLLDLIGPHPSIAWHWCVAFAGTFLILLPATAAMGATLPAMERLLGVLRRDGQSLSLLYAANTAGAVIGVLATAFVFAPLFGFTITALICAALNGLGALIAIALFPGAVAPVIARARARTDANLFVLALTGLLGVGYEVVVVRVLNQIAENTVYTFALLLSVYLIGTALGAAAYAHWMRTLDLERIRDRLLQLQAAACAVGVVGLTLAASIKNASLALFGESLTSALLAEALIAIASFLLPTLVMGALFSHLATRTRQLGTSFGHALGVNTIGAALAPLVFGAILVPSIGTSHALTLIVTAYLGLVSLRSWRSPPHLAFASALVVGLLLLPPLSRIGIPPQVRVVSHVEGVGATVSVLEDAQGMRTLHINNRQQEGSNATLVADGRQGLLPILLHPAPQRALFLGLGTGVTARTAALDRSLSVDVAELSPEVIDAAHYFEDAFRGMDPGPLNIFAADSRRFVRTSLEQYDVIVADNFHPARSGSGALYTTDHFAAVRDRLASGGLFCQWLPLHQLDLNTLRSIARSFLHEFPNGWAMLATNSLDTPVIGLVARNTIDPFDLSAARNRLMSAQLTRPSSQFGIVDELSLFGTFIAGSASLAQFAGNAALNTDDHPVVVYRAPQITYAPHDAPRDRLSQLLAKLAIQTDEVLAIRDAELARKLAAYWEARDRYIDAGRQVRPSPDVHTMLAQVHEPLLNVLRVSPEFRPAYDPLLAMARALLDEDPVAARALLMELHAVAPVRPEAAQLLAAISSSLLTAEANR